MKLLSNKSIEQLADQYAIRISIGSFTETAEELSQLLPPQYGYGEEASRRFHSLSRRREWLSARVLLHNVCGITQRLESAADGRPFLSGASSNVSLSHSGGYVAVVLSPKPVGVDIEMKGPRAYRLREKFMLSSETVLLDKIASEEQDAATILWSAKEAVYKCLAAPVSSMIGGICLRTIPTYNRLQAIADHPQQPGEPTHYEVDYRILPDFVMTIARQAEAVPSER